MKFFRLLPRGLGKIGPARREDDGARRVHDEPFFAAVDAGPYRFREVTVLGPDARDKDGHVADYAAHVGKLLRIRRTDHRATVAVAVPFLRRESRDDRIEGFSADIQLLYLAGARI